MRRRRSPSTDITVWDHVLLKQMLLSSPRRVLREFARCQVSALNELKVYRDIRAENPKAAERIAQEAQALGIPVRLGELLDDELAGPKGAV